MNTAKKLMLVLRGSGAAAFSYYVDSVTGNDANDGTSAATALATIGALPALTEGQSVGLARGSMWPEIISLGADNLSFEAYGTGNAPLFRCDDPIAPEAFSLSEHTDAGGVVYETAWVRGAGQQGGVDYVLLWEEDTRLVRKTSVALCAASAGSYYAPGENTASSTVYVHPYDSTNPTSDGKMYHISIRGSGIYAATRNGTNISGVHARRGWAHYGQFAPGKDSMMSQVIVEGGGIHHTVPGGSIEDIVVLDMALGHGITSPISLYRPDGSASDVVARRVFVVGDASNITLHSGLFAHTDGSPGWKSLTYDQCIVKYGGGFSGDTLAGSVTNSFVYRGQNPVSTNTRDSHLVERTMVYDGILSTGGIPGLVTNSGAPSSGVRTRTIRDSVIVITATDAANAALRFSEMCGTALIENCVIYFAAAVGGYAVGTQGFDATSRLAVTMRNCIIYMQKNTWTVDKPTTVDYTGENNIFYRTDFPRPAFRYHGAYIDGLADWQTATSSDADSVVGNPGFSGDPATGDFRLTPGGLAATMGCGPLTHWDWNLRAVVSGPPSAWPTPPVTLSEAEAYIAAPSSWNFYP